MDADVADVLRNLVGVHGADPLAGDPRMVRALLGDHCPERKREVAVLVAAAEIDVPQQLLRSDPLIGLEGLATRLEDERGLAPDVARWAVVTWAEALGVAAAPPRTSATGSDRTAMPPPKRAPTPDPRADEGSPKADGPGQPGPRAPDPVATAAASPSLGIPVTLLLLLSAWVVVVGITGVSYDEDLLCRLRISGRPPFVWLEVIVTSSRLFPMTGMAETCVALGWRIFSAGIVGLLLGVTAWRYRWF